MSSTTPPITVLIVDDHEVVRKGLLAFLDIAKDIKTIATAGTGAEAVKAVRQHKPQVVLLDLFLPDQPAAQTVQQIKAESPCSQIVMLTSHEGEEYLADLLNAGAISYILKDTKPEELITIIRDAAEGKGTLSPRLAQALIDNIGKEKAGLPHGLTEREYEVVQLIANGMTNGEIATHLNISEKTVKSHVSSILSKLYLADRTKVAVYAWREGLMR